MKSPSYFNNLEGLRGYMSIWVFITHAITMATLPFDKDKGLGVILADGRPAVVVFILLSGFVIHKLLLKNEPYHAYITRRGLRLFPIYLFSLIISILMLNFSRSVLVDIPWEHAKNVSRIHLIDLTKENFGIDLVSHLLLLHGIVPNNVAPVGYTLMGQAWSLTLEWQFYLVVPILHKLTYNYFSKSKSALYTAFLFAVVILAKLFMRQTTFLPNILHVFAIGYFTYQFLIIYRAGDKRFLFPFLITICLLEINNSLFDALPLIIWSVAIYSEVNGNKVANFILANKVAGFYGRISYSFYCMHMIALFLTSYFSISILKIDHQSTYAIVTILVSFLLTTVLSQFTYKYIEKPMISVGKKMFPAADKNG